MSPWGRQSANEPSGAVKKTVAQEKNQVTLYAPMNDGGVVDHDNVRNPTPIWGFCTLVAAAIRGWKIIVNWRKRRGLDRRYRPARVKRKRWPWEAHLHTQRNASRYRSFLSLEVLQRHKNPNSSEKAQRRPHPTNTNISRDIGTLAKMQELLLLFWARGRCRLSDRKHGNFVLVSRHFLLFFRRTKTNSNAIPYSPKM